MPYYEWTGSDDFLDHRNDRTVEPETIVELDAHVGDPQKEMQRVEAPDDAEQAFDASAFVDRTPMEDVIDDLESGEFDDHLDAIEGVAERAGVQDAIDDRREE